MQRFSRLNPGTTDQAVHAVSSASGVIRFLAGGTTMVDLMKLDVERPTTLVDITGIGDLRELRMDGGELVFGALVHMGDVAENALVKRDYPLLSEALWKAASQQLRNMATLGGNLLQRTRCTYFRDTQFPCNKRDPGTGCSAIEGLNRGHALFGASDHCIAVYPGDWAIALIAMDAVIDTQSPRGLRTVAIADLHRRPGDTPHIETALAADELILRIRVPASRLGKRSTYQKVRDRESYAFALVSAAVALDLDGETVRDARIALGGVASVPWRAKDAEQSLIGQRLTEDMARQAGRVAFSSAETRPQNAFRARLGIETVADALLIAKGRG
jgi:xanthine dehydrogenase YagS FAD-binding subunit